MRPTGILSMYEKKNNNINYVEFDFLEHLEATKKFWRHHFDVSVVKNFWYRCLPALAYVQAARSFVCVQQQKEKLLCGKPTLDVYMKFPFGICAGIDCLHLLLSKRLRVRVCSVLCQFSCFNFKMRMELKCLKGGKKKLQK